MKDYNEILNEHTAQGKGSAQQQGDNQQGNQGDNGAGGQGDQSGQQQQGARDDNQSADALKALREEFGVDTDDALRELLKKGKEPVSQQETPEEKAKREELEMADLQKFAVEKGVMKLEDFTQLSTLKEQKDADLVFKKYVQEWKEDNPEVDESEVDELAKQDFEKEYKLNSDNEKVKQRGIDRLTKDAAAIREPLLSSYNEAKSQFDTERDIRATLPKFTAAVGEMAESVVPKEKVWHEYDNGTDKIPIKVELNDDQRKEILDKVSKRLNTPEYFSLFKEGKLEEVKGGITEYADYLTTKKVMEEGNKKMADILIGLGIEKGSNKGARAPFGDENSGKQYDSGSPSRAENEKKVLEQFGGKKT